MSSMTTLPQPSGWVPTDSFGLRLVILRHSLGLSQEAAAVRCGLKPSTWATWEDPQRAARPRGMDRVVQQIAEGLGADRGWLMFGGPLHEHGPDTDPTQGTASSAWFMAGETSDGTVVPLFPSFYSDEAEAA